MVSLDWIKEGAPIGLPCIEKLSMLNVKIIGIAFKPLRIALRAIFVEG